MTGDMWLARGVVRYRAAVWAMNVASHEGVRSNVTGQ